MCRRYVAGGGLGVRAGRRPPDKIVDLGSKKIYVYSDIKVTFLNGGVSDVQ